LTGAAGFTAFGSIGEAIAVGATIGGAVGIGAVVIGGAIAYFTAGSRAVGASTGAVARKSRIAAARTSDAFALMRESDVSKM